MKLRLPASATIRPRVDHSSGAGAVASAVSIPRDRSAPLAIARHHYCFRAKRRSQRAALRRDRECRIRR